MHYDIDEHRHRFAVWAAARAAQRGFTTVGNLRDALDSSGIREWLGRAAALEVSAAEFNALHRQWCRAVCRHLNHQQISGVTFGRAAKLVAVYLKTIVLLGTASDSPLACHMHPPIDRILLQALSRSAVASPHKLEWAAINWTQLDEETYTRLIAQLRAALPQGAPFWTIEEYWQPSGDESTNLSE